MDQESKDKLHFFNLIAELLSTAHDAKSISDALYKIIDGFIDVPISAILLWDQHSAKLKVYGAKGFTEDEKIEIILDEVKSTGIAKRDVLTNQEFTNIVAAVMAK